ncbi:MAG: 1,4-alpha-glucan branching protein GlgB [Mariniblastus sp.]|nr:1,4-alpha-glucan branching protein GlgB [Mariniblastus sp.]
MIARNILTSVDQLDSVQELRVGRTSQPHDMLGPHHLDDNTGRVVVRAFLPTATESWIVNEEQSFVQPMDRVDCHGLFEVICNPQIFQTTLGLYQFRYAEGEKIMSVHDPYAFEPFLSDLDLHLFNEGNHDEIYKRLGAHRRQINGVDGVNFAVWAPNAESIALVGDFNAWDSRRHPMRKRVPSGVWELFVPDLAVGEIYKFRVTDFYGQQIEKSDPFGFFSELPPRTASVVTELDDFAWNDHEWMEKRAEQCPSEIPISVYELHLGSWRQDQNRENGWMNYREIAHQIVDYCREMNFTHIELMPVTEHPYTGSWGYQTVGYFACTSRYGTPEDFMYFVDYCHQNDLGVIIDWVPAHFPKDAHGLAKFDGTALYEHSDPRQGEHPDWNTLIFNYDRNEVRNFLVSNAMFWLEKYHIDGLRVDAVASMLYLDYSRKEGEWIPNKFGGRENLGAIDFLKAMNERVHDKFPGAMTLAEESTSWGGVSRPTYAGGLGFTMKWNMGWMNDTLRYFQKESVHRKYHHDELTFSLIYAFTENFLLPFSHDEVVHGKRALIDQMPGDLWKKFANLRLLFAYMWTHPGKKLIFMGCEWGQWNEWNCNSDLQWELLQLDSHKGVQKMVSDLNLFYKNEPALHQLDFEESGFEWVDCLSRELSLISYIRKAKDPNDFVVVCCNFTPTPHHEYRLGVPESGSYREMFNSDSEYYGGSNVGNGLGAQSEEIEAQERPHSIQISIPPMGVVIFKRNA